MLVHGDDFVAVADRKSIKDFKEQLESRFEVKTKVVGHREKEEVKETRILNRIIRATVDGWEYEPDQRHAELVVEQMGMSEANTVSTPGEDEKRWEEEENKKRAG